MKYVNIYFYGIDGDRVWKDSSFCHQSNMGNSENPVFRRVTSINVDWPCIDWSCYRCIADPDFSRSLFVHFFT